MPYRRLPNTDNARIRALKKAIEKSTSLHGREVVGVDIIKLKSLLRNFEMAQSHYQTSLEIQVEENKKMQRLVKSARLYVSHFIQVLNFTVIRNEIKKSLKNLYSLEPDDFTVPDITSNESLLAWGEKVIHGEQERMKQGGIPIYNPSIARVNVDFSLFKDAYIAQRTHQTNTLRQLDILSGQRSEIDDMLCEIWNQVENHYDYLPRMEKLEKCKEYGVVYYVRKKGKMEHSENN